MGKKRKINQKELKLIKEKRQIALISILSTLLLIATIFNFIWIYQTITYSPSSENYYDGIYGDLSDAYQTDKEVIKVYKLCLDSEIKSVCVYENIEFIWSESLESIRKDIFFSPTEMVKYNGYGVCRDIAVFRMAVFKKLNIYAEFVFTPEHVYVRAFEKGMIYELDNEGMRESDTIYIR